MTRRTGAGPEEGKGKLSVKWKLLAMVLLIQIPCGLFLYAQKAAIEQKLL